MDAAKQKMIEEVGDLLVVYLKAGHLGINSFINKAQLNISQIEQLLQIHFLLKKEVQTFIRQLPKQIRHFKTSTKVKNEVFMGEVRGQINWSNTIKERNKINPKDRTLFSCNQRNRNYDITENLILKELLNTIDMILKVKVDSERLIKYDYFKPWQQLGIIVDELLRKNIYLSKVTTKKVITDRMIQRTLRHRSSFYRDAARLLFEYRNLMRRTLDKDLVKQLLTETFIFPEKEEVLFELYWVMQIIKHNAPGAMLQLIDGRRNLVASWEKGDYLYNLYHDSEGSSQIQFRVSTDEVIYRPHPFIQKKVAAMKQADKIAINSFGSGFNTTNFWSGRPDILLELYNKETGHLEQLTIGEVKYTSRKEYVITGLRELMDYMVLVKDRFGDYLSDNSKTAIKGALFVGNIDIKATGNDDVQIYSFQNQKNRS